MVMLFLTGFFHTLLVILWLPYMSMGTLVFMAFYHYPGFFAWTFLNVGLAVFLNQARKAQQSERFDDRLSGERMEKAREWLYRRWKQR